LTQLYDLVLTPAGIKITQFTILFALAENGETAQWQMSRQLGVSTEGLSRRLSALRKAGWVQMRTGSARGEHLYRLTALGQAKLDHAMPYWRRAQERLCASSPEHDWSSLIMLADRITLAARAAEQKRTSNGIPSKRLESSPLSLLP
jgi:DNA-binding MarR family transcriptional regulator